MNIITHELLKSWNPCENGYKRFCELFPAGADLQSAIHGLVADGHEDWGRWLFDRCRERGLFPSVVANGYRNTGDWNTGSRNTGNENSGNGNTGSKNTGNGNTGYRNSGNWNTGNGNTGNGNTGNGNTGYSNSGDGNSGDRNSGDWNSGYSNSGNGNTGNRNTGNGNTGSRNSGDWNSGDANSGYSNSGYSNSGNWNSGNGNTGFFNSQTPETILVFNKQCDKNIWEDAYKPKFLYFSVTAWVEASKMTEQEKIDHPNFFAAGGYLKTLDYKEAFKASWDKADPEDRIKIKELPNFDAQVFYDISGIDLR